jgi:hypothetical protein
MPDLRPCLICRRPADDPLHGPPHGGRAHEVTPRIEQHDYDPGERRQVIRRRADREAILRRATGELPAVERRRLTDRRQP